MLLWSTTHVGTMPTQVLHPDLLNKNFTQAEYAVRGELYLKGEELRKQGREVIFTNGVALHPFVQQ